MKSAGVHLLNQYSFSHTQPFSFLGNSTGPILPFVVLALCMAARDIANTLECLNQVNCTKMYAILKKIQMTEISPNTTH